MLMESQYREIDVRPYSSALGAEIAGVDLSRPLDSATWSEIERAFIQYHVIFFHDQHISPAQQTIFSRRFGELEPYPYLRGIDGHPELIDIVKLPEETRGFGAGWHVDMSFREQPPLGTVLYALQMPPVGGDTLFANLCLAYEFLSDGMKSMLADLRAVHDSLDPKDHSERYKGMQSQKRKGAMRENQLHPLMRTHPVSGLRSLFISPAYCWQLDGMTVEESEPILDYLRDHATRHEFLCRFRWRENSIAVWDNRCTLHRVIEDDIAAHTTGTGFRRVMRRATIKGSFNADPPAGPFIAER